VDALRNRAWNGRTDWDGAALTEDGWSACSDLSCTDLHSTPTCRPCSPTHFYANPYPCICSPTATPSSSPPNQPSHPSDPAHPQVKETDSFHVARLARRDEDSGEDILVLLPTVEWSSIGAGEGEVHMRSLGYMGSFLLQYSSAQVRERLRGVRGDGRMAG